MNKKTPSIILVASCVVSVGLLSSTLAIPSLIESCYDHYQEHQERLEVSARFKSFCDDKDTMAKIKSLDDHDINKAFNTVREFVDNPGNKLLIRKLEEHDILKGYLRSLVTSFDFEIVSPKDKKFCESDSCILTNWEAVARFMDDAKKSLSNFQNNIRAPREHDKTEGTFTEDTFYEFYKELNDKISSLGDEYSYVKNSYEAVKEFYNFPSVKKLIRVSVPGKDGNHWEFKAVGLDDLSGCNDPQSLTNWEAIESFMDETRSLLYKLTIILKSPVATDENESMFYKFCKDFDHRISRLGDEYSYVKDSYKAVKEFYNFPNAKKLIGVSVPGKDSKHHHWQFKAVDRSDDLSKYDGKQLLIDWQAAKNFVYDTKSLLSRFSPCYTGLVSCWHSADYMISEDLKKKFKDIESSLKAADEFVRDPESKYLVRISKKDDRGVHDHWEFRTADHGSDLSEFDGGGLPLLLDWYALNSLRNSLHSYFASLHHRT